MEFGYFLMIKEAIGFNIKYLCKCADYKDPFVYKGSGVYWKKIITKYKPEIKTTILGHYKTNNDLREAGIYYSKLFNIVEDSTWANLIEEIGDGGPTIKYKVRAYNLQNPTQVKYFNSVEDIPVGWKRGNLGTKKTTESIYKTANWHRGRKRSQETRQKMKNAIRKKRVTVYCKYCAKYITPQNLVRHQIKCMSN